MRYSELAMSVQLHVEIPFHPDHRRQGVDVEELDGFGDSVFDEHALGVASDQFSGAEFAVIGQ